MGVKEIIAEYKRRKEKFREAKENQEIAEKLDRSRKSVDEVYLEKHYNRLRQDKLREMAHKIQRQEGAKMLDTRMPPTKNTLKMNLKLCSGGVKL